MATAVTEKNLLKREKTKRGSDTAVKFVPGQM